MMNLTISNERSLNNTDYNNAMSYAAKGGHVNIIESMISLSANNYNNTFVNSTEGGYINIMKCMIDLMNDNIDIFHTKPEEYCLSKYQCSIRQAMSGAAKGGHIDIIL